MKIHDDLKLQKTTVYVWKTNLRINRVGHVSMQTHGNNPVYVSYWPNKTSLQQFIKSGVAPSQAENLEEDIKQEDDCDPDMAITLDSLDVETMETAYNEFLKNGCNWSLWGSNYFKNKDTHNCSGLVGFLLAKGGIKRLVPTFNIDETGGIRNIVAAALKSAPIGLAAAAAATATIQKLQPGNIVKVKIAKSFALFPAASLIVNTSLTPNDIADLMQQAHKAETELLRSKSKKIVEDSEDKEVQATVANYI